MEAILILKNLNAARPYYAVEIPGNPVSLSTFAYLKDARAFARKQAQPGQKIELTW